MRRFQLEPEAEQSFDEEAENNRIDSELELSMKWENALAESGFEESIYEGDEIALVASINKALESMG